LSKTLAQNLYPLYSISLNKWYVDELYNSIFIKPYFLLANLFWKKGDEKIIDGYGPNGISKIVALTSNYLSRLQSGYLYHYAFAMTIGTFLVLWYLI
jgi:NADH-quinone oxidoreductase subunit L